MWQQAARSRLGKGPRHAAYKASKQELLGLADAALATPGLEELVRCAAGAGWA
jgi:hypothetical protein